MKTPYEIMTPRKTTLKYFHVFGAKCFVLKYGDDRRGKFEAKAHEVVFVCYSWRSYRVYIIGQHQVKESVNVTFDDTKLLNIQTEDASEKLISTTCQIQILMVKTLYLRLLLRLMSIMMVIMVKVVETLISMENPLTLVKNHQEYKATTHGEMLKDHLVIHNIKMSLNRNHQNQFPPIRSVWSRDHPLSWSLVTQMLV